MNKQYNCVNYLRLYFDSFCVIVAQILIVMCLLMISTFSIFFLMDLYSGDWMIVNEIRRSISEGITIIITRLRFFGIIYVSVSLIGSLIIVNRHALKYNFGGIYYLRLCIDLICVFALLTLIAICIIYASIYALIFCVAVHDFYDQSLFWFVIALNSCTMYITSMIFCYFCPNILFLPKHIKQN